MKRLEQIEVADDAQFFESLQAILRGIDEAELNGLFQAWVRRVEEESQVNGDSIG